MKIIELHQRTDDWKEWRLGKVGASDASVILGIDPYGKSLRKLWWEAKGIVPPESPGKEFIFSMGEKLEKIARQDILDMHEIEIVPICVAMDSNERIIASLDGYHKQVGPVEVKFCGGGVLDKAYATKEIPPHHYAQIQHQLMITDCNEAVWFGGDPNGRCLMLPILRNDQFISDLLEREVAFLAMLDRSEEPPLGLSEYKDIESCESLKELASLRNQSNACRKIAVLKEAALEKHGHPKIRGHGITVARTKNGSIQMREIKEKVYG